jgi:DNA-binding NarL/FixJ family response regulator
MHEFSKPGESCTDFEKRLIENAVIDDSLESQSDQLIFVAKRIGADSTAVMLDQFGNQRPYLPSRGQFFTDLFRPIRVQLVIGYRRRGLSCAEIAKLLRVSESTVDRDIRAGFGPMLRAV